MLVISSLQMDGSRPEVLDWLLGCAVRLEYGEKAGKYNKFTKEFVSQQRTAAPAVVSDNPLDNLDFSAPEFRAGVLALAERLKVKPVSYSNNLLSSITRSPSTLTTCSPSSPSAVLSPQD